MKWKYRQKTLTFPAIKKTDEHVDDGDIAVDTLGTVSRRLERELEQVQRGRVKTIPTQYFCDRLEYSEESWKSEDACCHLDSSENLVRSKISNSDSFASTANVG